MTLSSRPEPIHAEKEKEVFAFFNGAIQRELNIVFLKDAKGNDSIPTRIQMVLAFTLIDILASYWFEFKGDTGTPTERFSTWFDTFCRNRENTEWNRHKDWAVASTTRWYGLRSSLVHFLGLSPISENVRFGFVTNDLPDQDLQRLALGLSKNGKITIVIRPHDFNKLVRDGGVLMLNSWMQIIRQANGGDKTKRDEYIEGITRIWKKIQFEGAVEIVKPKPSGSVTNQK